MKTNKRFVDIQEQPSTPPTSPQGLRDFISSLIDEHRHTMAADLGSISPEKRLQILERLLPYVLPKQSEVRAEVTGIDLHSEAARNYLEREHLQKEQVDLFGNWVMGRSEEETSKVRDIQFAVIQELNAQGKLDLHHIGIRGLDEEKEIARDILSAVRTYAESKGIQLRKLG